MFKLFFLCPLEVTELAMAIVIMSKQKYDKTFAMHRQSLWSVQCRR